MKWKDHKFLGWAADIQNAVFKSRKEVDGRIMGERQGCVEVTHQLHLMDDVTLLRRCPRSYHGRDPSSHQ